MIRGSCLCGQVHASAKAFRWTAGEDRVQRYRSWERL